MRKNSDYKNQAIQALEGNWVTAAIMSLVLVLILQAPTLPYYFSGPQDISSLFNSSSFYDLICILLLPLIYGYTISFLGIIRGESLEFVSLFDGFKEYGRTLGTIFLMYVFVFLWSLLLVIPGIIKSYSYSQTLYVMRDNPNLSFNAAIEKSMYMMRGKKMQLFLLDLSLIGWAILSCLTLGIGFLFLYPYYMTSHAAFYQDLKKEKYGSIEIIED